MANSENTKDGNSQIIENLHANHSLLRYNNTHKEVNNELLEAYQRASDALESIKVKASQKAFEETQINAETLTEEVWLETQCLSKQLHGLSYGENKTWNHSIRLLSRLLTSSSQKLLVQIMSRICLPSTMSKSAVLRLI